MLFRSSFVLDRLAGGSDVRQALRDALALGLAEADPTLDLNGSDVADKLCWCANSALGINLERDAVEIRGIDSVTATDLAAARQGAGRIRLVASLLVEGDRCAARVAPTLVTPTHPLAFLRNDESGALVRCHDGKVHRCGGRGAGRWPTAEAVVADLLDVVREREECRVPADGSLMEALS